MYQDTKHIANKQPEIWEEGQEQVQKNERQRAIKAGVIYGPERLRPTMANRI